MTDQWAYREVWSYQGPMQRVVIVLECVYCGRRRDEEEATCPGCGATCARRKTGLK